ncbi:uncharacterized protein si:dkey-262k9.2 isoform X1 [Xyrichtys novacula]|uniref:Uncharacterized protein si:dkey-262k9.2 isoform X1 n=1 Tax=Xyrichtys novacula TaxID=13765 RepID=A0AAV1FLK6_XYRNO|nr:uncharacterized protein si:dkey-262k9.2 isoform X1 [Xyrichtys novacula]
MLDRSMNCMAPTEHLKMMRLLFLCLLLLLPAATVSQDQEGSGDDGVDDEDGYLDTVGSDKSDNRAAGTNVDKTTGVEDSTEDNKFTLIVIIAAVAVLTLSVAAIVTIMLVRRHMQYRQQGIYSVPAEQDQKGAVPFLVE